MTAPARIQRRRVKGWRMPPGAIYVGRPTRWANPWPVDKLATAICMARDFSGIGCSPLWNSVNSIMPLPAGVVAHALAHTAAVELYRAMAANFAATEPEKFAEWIAPLRGKNLACWCPLDQPCHGGVLIEIANPDHKFTAEAMIADGGFNPDPPNLYPTFKRRISPTIIMTPLCWRRSNQCPKPSRL